MHVSKIAILKYFLKHRFSRYFNSNKITKFGNLKNAAMRCQDFPTSKSYCDPFCTSDVTRELLGDFIYDNIKSTISCPESTPSPTNQPTIPQTQSTACCSCNDNTGGWWGTYSDCGPPGTKGVYPTGLECYSSDWTYKGRNNNCN